MRTAFNMSLASPVPGFLIYLYLKAVQQFVETAKKINH
jgi:hypothetical protein